MKSIQAFATVFNADGKPAAGAKLRLEHFQLASNSWAPLVSGSADAKGQVVLSVKLATADVLAPSLRLCEEANGSRVLAQVAKFSYTANTQALLCDFGQIEMLGEQAYTLLAVQSQFANQPLQIAGAPKHATFNTSVLMRAAVLNPTATSALARGALDTSALSIDASSAAIAAARDTTIALAQPAEIDSSALGTFNAEMIKFKALETQLQLQISDKDRLLQSKDIALQAKAAELQTIQSEALALKSELAQIRASEAQLKVQNEEFKAEAVRLSPIQTIASNIGAQVAAANQKLQADQKPYQIQNIQVELRGTLSGDGQAMNLVKLGELKEGLAHTSLVRLDLTSSNPKPAENTTLVPDVTGFTESVVRRLLSSVGLRMEKINRSAAGLKNATPGQALSQSPAPGSAIPRNEAVLVVFAVEP